ncbi:MAG: CapA family protein, partial [Pyrinomonadaceae bacterium]
AVDLAFGNLEGPMLEGGSTSKCGAASHSCFAFRVPTRFGRHLKSAGFDVMNLANNHASDFGENGRNSSKKVLEGLGIKHDGADETDIARLEINGNRISIIGFATNRVSLNLNDIEIASRAVAEEKKNADLVFVSFHGGAEGEGAQHVPRGNEIFLGESRGNLRAFTHAVVDAGADLVIGHGPHVVRAMEVYKDHLIVYSLGNFCTYGFRLAGATALSMILEAKIGPDGKFLGGKVHAARQIGAGVPSLDPGKVVLGVLRNLSTADFGPSAVKIDADGTISAP